MGDSVFKFLTKKTVLGIFGGLLIGLIISHSGSSPASNSNQNISPIKKGAIEATITQNPSIESSTIPILTLAPTLTPTLIPTNTPTPIAIPVIATPTPTSSNLNPQNTSSSNNYYINSSGNTVQSPTYSTDNSVPAGATAQCNDGTYSFSQHRQGTCSHHGGVSKWF